MVWSKKFYHGDDVFPRKLVTRCVFFVDSLCGPQRGFRRDLPGKVIQWDAGWGEDYKDIGAGLLDVWAAEKRLFDEVG